MNAPLCRRFGYNLIIKNKPYTSNLSLSENFLSQNELVSRWIFYGNEQHCCRCCCWLIKFFMKQGFNVVGKKAFLSRLQRLARTNFLQSLWAVQLWGRNNNFQTFFPECSIEDVNSFSTQKMENYILSKNRFYFIFFEEGFPDILSRLFLREKCTIPTSSPTGLGQLEK